VSVVSSVFVFSFFLIHWPQEREDLAQNRKSVSDRLDYSPKNAGRHSQPPTADSLARFRGWTLALAGAVSPLLRSRGQRIQPGRIPCRRRACLEYFNKAIDSTRHYCAPYAGLGRAYYVASDMIPPWWARRKAVRGYQALRGPESSRKPIVARAVAFCIVGTSTGHRAFQRSLELTPATPRAIVLRRGRMMRGQRGSGGAALDKAMPAYPDSRVLPTEMASVVRSAQTTTGWLRRVDLRGSKAALTRKGQWDMDY